MNALETMDAASLTELFKNKDNTFWGISFNEDIGSRFTRLKYDYSGVCCTGFAAEIRRQLGPDRVIVYGFYVNENPSALICTLADGHDFAVVESRYIVDPWLTEVENGEITTHNGLTINVKGQMVFDMEDPGQKALIKVLYGQVSNWSVMEVD